MVIIAVAVLLAVAVVVAVLLAVVVTVAVLLAVVVVVKNVTSLSHAHKTNSEST